MAGKPESARGDTARYSAGQRLQCARCGSEIEITNPCTCNPPHQSFRCCDEEMTPTNSAETPSAIGEISGAPV